MRRQLIRTSHVAGLLAAAWLLPAVAHAQVRDDAHLFSPGAVSDATAAIDRMRQQHGRGLFVETVAKAPSGVGPDKAALEHWTTEQADDSGVNGVFVMVCMDPRFAQVKVGKNVASRGDITKADNVALFDQLRSDLGAKNDDKALADVVQGVERAYTTNIPQSAGARSSSVGGVPAAIPRGNVDAGDRGVPSPAPAPSASHPVTKSLGIGSLVCIAIALLIVFSLVRKLFSRNQGGGGGGGFGGGGFGGGGSPTYPAGGPAYGNPGVGMPVNQGGGGGFGRGLLGGLLGGAVGGYATDRLMHHNDPAGGGGGAVGGGETSGGFGGGGGGNPGFDAGPSDAGQFTDSGPADVGGSFGGGDAGGGGGDSGGGGGDTSGGF